MNKWDDRIPMNSAKKRLATLWFSASGILLATMILQTVMEHYAPNDTEAFGWFFPTLMPTLSLIVGVLVGDALGKSVKIATVDKFMYRLAIGVSSMYFFAVGVSIFISPFVPSVPPIELLRKSNLWLGPMQGLVSAILGLFFLKRPSTPSEDDNDAVVSAL